MNQARLAAHATFELIADLEVIGDVVRFRKAPRSPVARLWTSLSGEKRRLDELRDSHSARGMENMLALILHLRDTITESDTLLAKTIEKLRSVDEALAANGTEVDALRRQVVDLQGEFGAELEQLGIRVNALEANDQAAACVAALDYAARRGTIGLVELWYCIDELWWGPFGAYQRNPRRDAAVAVQQRAFLLHEISRILEDRCDMRDPFAFEPLLLQVESTSVQTRDELEVLALDPAWTMRPLTRAVLERSRGVASSEEARFVPVITTPERIVQRLVDEAAESTTDR